MTMTKKVITIIVAVVFSLMVIPVAFNGYQAVGATRPAQVKNLKATVANENTEVQLTWSKAKYAKKYQVYEKKGIDDYKRVKTTSAKKLTLKRDAGTYKYKVRAIRGKIKGKFSKAKIAVVEAIPVKVKNVTAKSIDKNTKIKLTWSKAKYATQYNVFEKNEDGYYECIETTKATSISFARYSGNYSYKVQGENEKASGKLSNACDINIHADKSEVDPLITYGGNVINLNNIKKTSRGIPQSALGHYYTGTDVAADTLPKVYYTKNITSDGLVGIYKALNWTPNGKLGVKISTGESNVSNQLDPNLIKDLVQGLNGTIVECNTAYGGVRGKTSEHYQVAREHGYVAIADVDIMDGDKEDDSKVLTTVLDVPEGKTFERLKDGDIVGEHFKNYGSFIVLSHFKGHSMGGFGGAIKNTSIGFAAAPMGKCYIHSGGRNKTEWRTNSDDDSFQEAMAEAAMCVSNAMDGGKNIIYISVMNRMSVDCDCVAKPRQPDIHDVGIVASTDPIALDQACVDLASCMEGSGQLMWRIAERHGIHSLEHGESLGFGSRDYNLINTDN